MLTLVSCRMMKNVHGEFVMHTKKAFEVCYLGKKTKMNLDVGFRN
jgi:hypothetical protein